MSQAIHILKKDIHYLWGQILLLMILFAFQAQHPASPQDRINFYELTRLISVVLPVFLPIACVIVVAVLVHNEPLLGDRHFWLTRPYSRRSLLAAKLMFVLLFITLPSLVADCFRLAREGFPLLPYWSDLLWKQVLGLLLVLIPALAVASMTTLRQLLRVSAALFFASLAFSWLFVDPRSDAWRRSNWAALLVGLLGIAAGSLFILAWQYFRRRAVVSWIVAFSALALSIASVYRFPWETTFALQSILAPGEIDPASVNLRLDPPIPGIHPGSAMFPLRFEGPPNTQPWPLQIQARLEADGKSWPLEIQQWTLYPSQQPWPVDSLKGILQADSNTFDRVRNHTATIRGVAHITLFSHPQPTRVNKSEVFVPGVGICDGRLFICRTAFDGPVYAEYNIQDTGVSEKFAAYGYRGPLPHTQFFGPIRTGSQKIYANTSSGNESLTVTTWKVEGHLRKEFTITGVRLADYAVLRPIRRHFPAVTGGIYDALVPVVGSDRRIPDEANE